MLTRFSGPLKSQVPVDGGIGVTGFTSIQTEQYMLCNTPVQPHAPLQTPLLSLAFCVPKGHDDVALV